MKRRSRAGAEPIKGRRRNAALPASVVAQTEPDFRLSQRLTSGHVADWLWV